MTDVGLELEPPPVDPCDLPNGTVVYLDNRPKGHPKGPDLWALTYLDGEWLCAWGRAYEMAGIGGGELFFIMTLADQRREVAELGADPATVATGIRVADHTGLASCRLCRHVHPAPAEQCPACYLPATLPPPEVPEPSPDELDFGGEFERADERPTPFD